MQRCKRGGKEGWQLLCCERREKRKEERGEGNERCECWRVGGRESERQEM